MFQQIAKFTKNCYQFLCAKMMFLILRIYPIFSWYLFNTLGLKATYFTLREL